MKKLGVMKIFAIIMVLIMSAQMISVYATQSVNLPTHESSNDVERYCSHEWKYVGQGVSGWIMKDSQTHGKCYTDIYKCTKCGAVESYVQQNSWTNEIEKHTTSARDLGHVHGQNKHKFNQYCTAYCGYSRTLTVTCYGPPCVSVNSIDDSNHEVEETSVLDE